ncbi:(4Fe-4S)-binding protein, partial [Streptomyces noursei]
WQDLEVFLQLLPRSSTAERMNPYTTTWTGTAAVAGGVRWTFTVRLRDGEGRRTDGPRQRDGRQAPR